MSARPSVLAPDQQGPTPDLAYLFTHGLPGYPPPRVRESEHNALIHLSRVARYPERTILPFAELGR